MSVFLPITKVDVARQLVYGTLSEEVRDSSDEILDYASAKPQFQAWSEQFRQATRGKSLGNVRVMHQGVAAGKFVDIRFDDAKKRVQGIAKIIDKATWNKVLEGVYTGFSIGGSYLNRWPDKEHPGLTRYTPSLTEISLVDNPAVSSATFEIVKRDGSVAFRKFLLHEGTMSTAELASHSSDDEASQVAALLDGLGWLADELGEDGDEEVLAAIELLEDYLGEDNDDVSGEEAVKMTATPAAKLAVEAAPQVLKLHKLAPMLRAMDQQLQALGKRLATLEAQPLPGKGVIRGMETHHEAVPLSKEQQLHEKMKQALARPVVIG